MGCWHCSKHSTTLPGWHCNALVTELCVWIKIRSDWLGFRIRNKLPRVPIRQQLYFKTGLRIRIRFRIHIIFQLLDPFPDPFPDPCLTILQHIFLKVNSKTSKLLFLKFFHFFYSTFLGPNGTRCVRCHFKGPKKISISGSNPSNGPRYGFPPIQIHTSRPI